jgi:hypothetical protein
MFLTGETAQLSPRDAAAAAKRSGEWHSPGSTRSGTAATFAVLNLLAILLVAMVAIMLGHIYDVEDTPQLDEWLPVGSMRSALAGYLGLTRILILAADASRRWAC